MRIQLRELWQALLPGEQFEDTTPFHEAGGSSLALMRLFMRGMKVFGVRLEISQYPQLQSIEQQARYILAARKDGSDA
ncbi:acyl carrier protein [Pseudomonas promysalinigenes]|uniref:Carrier protein n=1 Tax=Pseudomonas putida TaxID=303 RepID=G8AA79_PSEPU|nr:acyl carrier protein [Pseudomonas promysalinigenes]ADQ74609.1 carrier protein [Pseudomonas putida]QXI32370.1 acyl carrier protein [Pseudomonas promysalinigenes]